MIFNNFILKVVVLWLASIFASAAIAGGVPNVADIPRAEQPKKQPSTRPVDIKQEEKLPYQPVAGSDAIKISVDRFVFSGNASFTADALNALLTDYQNRQIGMNALNDATQVITAFYRKHGYFLAQAYLPTQDIAGNTVEITVIEGQLGELSTSGTAGFDAVFMQNIAAYRLQPGDTVSERNLVRNVSILNALPATRATAQLSPNDRVGATDIEVTLEPLPKVQAYLGGNTYGNRFTGREVLIAGAKLNNPAGLGDQLSLDLKRARANGQRGLNFGYTTPVHAAGTLLSLGYNYVDYKLGRELAPLDASGESQYFNIALDHPVIRDAQKGVTAHFATSYKVMNDEVGLAALENRRKITAAEVGLVADWLNAAGNVSHQAGINIRGGRLKFNNDTAENIDQIGADTKGGFVKYNLTASRLQYFDNGSSLSLHADYQRASKNLDSVEKMSIGGVSAWRQYAELPSLADTGLVLGAEFRQKLTVAEVLTKKGIVDISPYVFLDLGRGKINQKALSGDNHVKSIQAGLGVDATFKQNWVLSVSGSHQNRDFSGEGAENELRFWGQLIKYF